jgi:hypothetical protein
VRLFGVEEAVIVRPASAGMRGVDTNTKLTAASAKALKATGEVDFVMRYLSLTSLWVNDIDAPEVDAILSAGLGLGLVQHCRIADTFRPTGAQGLLDGKAAVAWAARAGISGTSLNDRLTLVYDCEGLSHETAVNDMQAYDAQWCAPVNDGLFMPGGYFGYQLPILLTAEDLWLLHVERYWKSGSYVIEPANCGWCMVQDPQFNQKVGGVTVDWDGSTKSHGIMGDKLGRFPNLLWAA